MISLRPLRVLYQTFLADHINRTLAVQFTFQPMATRDEDDPYHVELLFAIPGKVKIASVPRDNTGFITRIQRAYFHSLKDDDREKKDGIEMLVRYTPNINPSPVPAAANDGLARMLKPVLDNAYGDALTEMNGIIRQVAQHYGPSTIVVLRMVLEKSRHQMAYTTAPVIIKYTEAPDLVTRENFQLSFVPLFSNYDQQQGVCMGVPVTSIVADIPTMVISPCAPSKSPHVVYVEDMPEQITSNSFLVTTSSRYPNLDGFMQFDAQQGKMVMKHSAYHFKDTNFLKGDGATSSLVIPI